MSILISALRANANLAANASSNIANMNTHEYKAIETTIVPSVDNTVEISTSRSDEPAPLDMEGRMESNVDVAKEFTDLMQAKTGFEAALNAIRTREDMLDDLMKTFSRR
jgi:flagellar hook protein FlgE